MAKKERFPSESLKIQLSTPSSDVLKELKPKSKSSKKSKKSARKKKTERSKSKKQKQKKETTQEIYLSAETLFSGKLIIYKQLTVLHRYNKSFHVCKSMYRILIK